LSELENIIIPTAGNNKPIINSVLYSVNGSDFSEYKIGNIINIKKSDQLKIKVNATDPDADKINFFWGVTNLKKQSTKYQMKLIKGQNENIFTYQPQDEKTEYFIGFIISDRKSFLGPFTASVRVE